MFVLSLQAMEASGCIDAIVLVAPSAEITPAEALVADLGRTALVRSVVSGGSTRQQSVGRGLGAIPEDAEVVVCHDAARPFASAELYARVVARLRGEGSPDGVVPVVPSPDTVKRLRDRWVAGTLPRHELGLAQTPQAFVAAALRTAHDRAAFEATDDAMLLEAAGFRVAVVEGETSNFKVTSPADLARAEHVLAGMAAPGRGDGQDG
jgi:2-C-methyl-D-erythritol 4-phosphate cytidylyltransferase